MRGAKAELVTRWAVAAAALTLAAALGAAGQDGLPAGEPILPPAGPAAPTLPASGGLNPRAVSGMGQTTGGQPGGMGGIPRAASDRFQVTDQPKPDATTPTQPGARLLPPSAGGFTGRHSTLPSGPGGLAADANPLADAPLPYYLDLQFLYVKRQSPTTQPRLFDVFASDSPNPTVPDNGYFAGTVTTSPRPGFQGTIGRKVSDTGAIEFTGMVIDRFFFKRVFNTFTSTGGFFGGVQSNTAVFTPTGETLDRAVVEFREGLFSEEAQYRACLLCDDCTLWEATAGLKHLRYSNRLNYALTVPGRLNPDGTPASPIVEGFDTTNNLFGPVLGTNARRRVGEFVWVGGGVRYAPMVNFENQFISGPVFAADDPLAAAGRRLTGPNNLGGDHRTGFSNYVDVNVHVAAQLTPHLEFAAGYNLWHFSNVGRSANLIDTDNLADPQRRDRRDSFFMHGLNLSLRLEY